MTAKTSQSLQIVLKIANDLGYELNPESVIMDFGCGAGKVVGELRGLGYQAFGCDIKFKDVDHADTKLMQSENLIRLIDMDSYKLPFDDDAFDLIISDQVFEHVQNYSETIAELGRILKKDGCCIHIFPSRYKPIEAHVYVPFSSVIRSRAWLWFWAKMGIRNRYQARIPAAEAVDRNFYYLNNNTNYLSKTRIRREFEHHFASVVFCEDLFLKNSRRGRYIYSLSRILPFLPAVYSTFRSRVVATKKPN